MHIQLGLRSKTRSAIVAVLALVGLLSAAATLAQTGTSPPPLGAPGSAGRQPPSTEQLNAWRARIAKTPMPKKGCFTTAYPSTEWKEVPCVTPPARPYPPPAVGSPPPNVVGGGGSNDVAAQVTGLISSASGSFDSANNVTTETGTTFGSDCSNSTSGVANTFSLQLNTRPFTTSVCTSTGCQGWQQFVYSNSGFVFIQYWLLSMSVHRAQQDGTRFKTARSSIAGRMIPTASPSRSSQSQILLRCS